MSTPAMNRTLQNSEDAAREAVSEQDRSVATVIGPFTPGDRGFHAPGETPGGYPGKYGLLSE